jgi:uncharacterized membrane protein YkgB
VWEIVIGMGFLTGVFRRLVVLMTFATMFVTLSILWLAPQRVWTEFPFRLSFDGLYVVKDLVIAAAAIVIAVSTVQERPALDGRFADLARRVWPWALERYAVFERRAIAAVAPWSLLLLRGALAFVFIWFGLLNLLDPTSSATWPMVQAVLPGEVGAALFRVWGLIGIVAGVGVGTRRYQPLAVALLVGMMVVSLSWFVLAPGVMFQQPPLVLTLEGQHVVKNLVLAAGAIAVLRGGLATVPKPTSVPAAAEGGRA